MSGYAIANPTSAVIYCSCSDRHSVDICIVSHSQNQKHHKKLYMETEGFLLGLSPTLANPMHSMEHETNHEQNFARNLETHFQSNTMSRVVYLQNSALLE